MAAPKGHENYNKENIGRPKKYTQEFIDNEAIEFEKWLEIPDNIFALKFAYDRKFPREYLTEFARDNVNFAHIFARAKVKQECYLVQNGLNGKFKEGMAKFVLANHHGYTEKQQSEVNSNEKISIQMVNYSQTQAIEASGMVLAEKALEYDAKPIEHDSNKS